MQRSLTTVLTFLCLTGVYRAYAYCVVPLTESASAPTPPPLSGDVDFQPPIFLDTAESYFPDAPWTKTADLKWQRSEEAILFSETVTRDEESGNVVRMEPLAILWKDPRRPEAPPLRLIAEAAQVQFQNQFFDSAIQLSDANPGRIVWASLEGKVHIDGPDGLEIDGHHFIFSEESAQLYSDYPISFHYGPTPQDQTEISGKAEQINLSLLPASDSILGNDMPLVGGLSGMMLRRNVVLDVAFQDHDENSKVRVTSAGPFEYDVASRTVTFEDNVRVRRWSSKHNGTFEDSLNCEWLGLGFDAAAEADGVSGLAAGGLFDGVQFRQMRARGTRVTVKSQEHDVTAAMQVLSYDALKRTAAFVDDRGVSMVRGNATFTCPRVSVEHTEDGDIEHLECDGNGSLTYQDPRLGPDPLEAKWAGSVNVVPDPAAGVHLVTLNEATRFLVPQQLAIAANRMKLWLDLKTVQSESESDDFLHKPLPIKRARAEGDVRMASQQLIVRRANSVDATISHGRLDGADSGVSMAGGEGRDAGAETADNPWLVWSDDINVAVVHDPESGKLDARRVTARGKVVVQHHPRQKTQLGKLEVDGPFELKGNQLIAENSGGLQQVLTIVGEVNEQGDVNSVASASLGAVTLAGASIRLDRQANQVTIPAAGAFQVPISNDLDGVPLEQPGVLLVRWQEQMLFDGQTASFFGTVRCSLRAGRENDSTLHCEELSAQLNHRISFANPDQQPENVTIDMLRARHGVRLEGYEYEGTRLTGVRQGRLAEFQVSQTSGDFTGTGPGAIDIWSFGDTVRFAPADSAKANQPAKRSPTQWRYSHVRFSGKIVGNVHQSAAELSDRVEFLTAPVNQAMMKFKRDDLSQQTQQAANAIWLGCDRLRITQRASGEQERKFAVLFAYGSKGGSTELEGHFGRAVADELSFDERHGRFVLRGIGRDATLYFQRAPGEPIEPSSHRLIEFIPAKQSITVDGSTGLRGGF